jgi:hypothetical protein
MKVLSFKQMPGAYTFMLCCGRQGMGVYMKKPVTPVFFQCSFQAPSSQRPRAAHGRYLMLTGRVGTWVLADSFRWQILHNSRCIRLLCQIRRLVGNKCHVLGRRQFGAAGFTGLDILLI